ncbi:MAG: ATP phosphoribosyltransferase [Clostridia bacterium]|nr:ATP phosphoribosyltransferase [Clostridia bacterium]
MPSNLLTIALPKGKLGAEAVALLGQAGLPTEGLETDSRQLLFDYPQEGYRYIICRPTDIPVYVDHGAAALGVVGKDTIEEAEPDVFELVDLKFGFCRFVVALPEAEAQAIMVDGKPDLRKLNHKRVASKFPRVAEKYFTSLGMQVEVIKLHGNIELAPRVGLAEMIVDIVSTGRTLKENQLVAVSDIFSATARLIANRVAYRMEYHRLEPLIQRLKQVVGNGG